MKGAKIFSKQNDSSTTAQEIDPGGARLVLRQLQLLKK
jgi:hypothetical protein